MAARLIKTIIGILFIPPVISITKSFYVALTSVHIFTDASRYFLWGLIAYVIVYIAFFKMDFLYVLGHEAVHAVFVWLFGGRVTSFQVNKKGGSVGATKSNIVIELSPYFIPIYTMVITLLYFLLSSFWKLDFSLGCFMFLVGFSVSFHMVMTVDKVKIEQPDFLRIGYLNSLVIIYIINVLMISFFSSIMLPDFSFSAFFAYFIASTKELYVIIINQLFFL